MDAAPKPPNAAGPRAPLFVALPALVAGYLVADACTVPVVPVLLTAIVFAIASTAFACRRRGRIWLGLFTAAATLLFAAYGTLRLPPNIQSERLQQPPREATVEFRVLRLFNGRNNFNASTGIGRVLSADHLARLKPGDYLFFDLKSTDPPEATPGAGAQLRGRGVLRPLAEGGAYERDPDFEAFLRGAGAYFDFGRGTFNEVPTAMSPVRHFFAAINQRLQSILRAGEPGDPRYGNVYVAMLLGKKSVLSPTQKDLYQVTGTMHLFAVSGLHVGVIAAVIAHLLQLVRLRPKVRPLIGLPLLYFYVQVTGAAPSAQRAFLMAAFFWIAYSFSRQRSSLAAWTASALGVLLIMPGQLWSVGFQLSYAVVLSILLFGIPLNALIQDRLAPNRFLPEGSLSGSQKVTGWLFKQVSLLFAISLSAWLASAPLIALHFGLIVPGAVFLNVVLVTLATVVIITGVLSGIAGMLFVAPVSAFLNHAAWLLIAIMEWVLGRARGIPGMHLRVEDFGPIAAYLTLVVFLGTVFVFQGKFNRFTTFASLPFCVLAGLCIGTIFF